MILTERGATAALTLIWQLNTSWSGPSKILIKNNIYFFSSAISLSLDCCII